MALENLPGIVEIKQDGNLISAPVNDNPIVMVIGTASQGDSETVHRVDRVSESAAAYSRDGTLTRGLYETSLAGALNIRLFRIGATNAVVDMTTDYGVTIETVAKDDSAGTDYLIYWNDTTGRVKFYRAADDELVYDNYPTSPDDRVDLGEIAVTGTWVTGTGDIGEELGVGSGPITLAAAGVLGNNSYTAGTDGLNLSRMELYEALYNAYELLEDQEIDVVVPMNVYLDDLNVMDMNEATVSSLALTSLLDYPTAGASDDALGKVYTEEYEGVNYFWWWFPSQPAAAAPSFSAAQLYTASGIGSATASTKTDGTALAASDFHEVNFAYQLANFCYNQAQDNMDMTGVIGVLPPNSFTLKDVSRWVGTLPTTEVDATTGNTVIATGGNGTGLLGNKFMSGRISSGGASGYAGWTINGVDGLSEGGFIATDTGWLDGTQQTDDNDHLVDIGKYLSVVATYPVLANPSRSTSYTATGAPSYGGFYSTLAVASSPSNKLLGNVRLPFRLNLSKLDLLAGQRYVTFHAKTRGIVVSDAPTAARPDSDYQRLSTVRQVKATIDEVRAAGEPFLGESMTGAQIAALDTKLDRTLQNLVRLGVLQRYEYRLIVTPQMKVLGQAAVELRLVPAFELRRITVTVGLAAV